MTGTGCTNSGGVYDLVEKSVTSGTIYTHKYNNHAIADLGTYSADADNIKTYLTERAY